MTCGRVTKKEKNTRMSSDNGRHSDTDVGYLLDENAAILSCRPYSFAGKIATNLTKLNTHTLIHVSTLIQGYTNMPVHQHTHTLM